MDSIKYQGSSYKWFDDKTCCKDCLTKDKCKTICNNKAGYMKRVNE